MNSDILKFYLSRNLKEKRLQKRLTQTKVAEILRINRSTYTYYERGQTAPSIYNLVILADLYQTTIDELVGR